MSFFRKLKEKLFKSSSRLDQGIDELVQEESEEQPEPKGGILSRLTGKAPQEAKRRLDDEMLESLEDLLIAADMGAELASKVTASVAEDRFGDYVSSTQIKNLIASEITKVLTTVAKPLPIYPETPQVILVVGVNGTGKTTTIGKLASQFHSAGKKVMIAAGDTFRAAAVDQLKIWGERANVPVFTAKPKSDPAALAYSSIERAVQEKTDLLLIDTAGRLQNRKDLMQELSRIIRVIKKVDPTAPHNTLLVLDATTGQNAILQAEVFREMAAITGLVMTKLDGTAKGGILVALATKFGLPVHAIGVGEQIDDLAPFDPDEFSKALTGVG